MTKQTTPTTKRQSPRLLDFLSAAISVVALAAFTWWWLSLAADSVTAGVA